MRQTSASDAEQSGASVSAIQRCLWKPAECHGLVLLVLVALLAIGFIGPVREAAFGDEWAYCLTVRHLALSGEYRLHDWAAANMDPDTSGGLRYGRPLL